MNRTGDWIYVAARDGRRSVEGQALPDAGDHGLVDLAVFSEVALALRVLGRRKVAQAGLATHDLARPGHFHSLGRSFFRLATCD